MFFYKPKLQFIFYAFVSLIICFSGKTLSKNIYVSPNGNNTNSGFSISSSIQSINLAVKIADSGDTIYLLPGTYKELINFENKNGEPEKSISLIGCLSEGNYPVIDGGAEKPLLDGMNDWLHIENSSWIRISRIKFQNGWTNPVKVFNSSYITFDSCFFTGGKRVINAGGELTHHILIENCYWDQGGNYLWSIVKDSSGVDAWLSMHHKNMAYFNGSLIDFSGTGGSIVIRGNTVINAFNALRWRGVRGFDSNIEIYGNKISRVRDNDFEPEYYTYNLLIYHNLSHNIHRTLSIDNVEGGCIYYFGNIITADSTEWTKTVCTSFGKIYGNERQLDYPLYVFSNSFYGPEAAYKMDDGTAVNFKHYNNAYYFTGGQSFILNKWEPSDEFDYDISNKPWPENIIKFHQEKHGLISIIKYVDPEEGNLRLQKDSPGIDAGRVLKFPELGWTEKFAGGAPDIGAYENGEKIDGPAFRFRIPPDGKINYKEKPRIVKYLIDGYKVILFFSDKIEESSINIKDINLFSGKNKMIINSVSFPNEYEMRIETNLIITHGELSLSFNTFPKGINGENVTYWASAIRIHSIQ